MTISIDIKNLALKHLINNKPIKEISNILNISLSTVYFWNSLYNENIKNNIHIINNKNYIIHKSNIKYPPKGIPSHHKYNEGVNIIIK